MNLPGNQLLSGSTLPFNENREIGRGHALDGLSDAPDRVARSAERRHVVRARWRRPRRQHGALFDTILSFNNYDFDEVLDAGAGGLEIGGVQFREGSHYPITVLVDPGELIRIRINYDCTRFGKAAIRRILEHLEVLLEAMPAHPGRAPSAFSLLTQEEERHLLVGFNQTEAPLPGDLLVTQLFEEQVRQAPEAVALRYGEQILTYAQLDRQANRLAHLFRKQGVGPEQVVAICLDRSPNHASIIYGIRHCKAQRYRYKNNDLADLEAKLKEADTKQARFKMIATDGVFSMDGYIANLAGICDLAENHNALVMVDDSHAVGFMGRNGRGTHEHCGVMGRVDILTGTMGKALGGASGGYTSGRREIIEFLRQRSRPYLFSNTLAPSIVPARSRSWSC